MQWRSIIVRGLVYVRAVVQQQQPRGGDVAVFSGFQKPAAGGDRVGCYAVAFKERVAEVKLRDGILQSGAFLEKKDGSVRPFFGAPAQLMASPKHPVGFNGTGKGGGLEMFEGALKIRLVSQAVIVIQAEVKVVVRLGFVWGRQSCVCVCRAQQNCS